MSKSVQYIAQGLFYAIFAVVIGFFSNSPAYTHLPPDETLIKLSFRHAGQLKGECRQLSAAELAKLPAYKRKGTQECPRERADVVVELEMDGMRLYHEVLRPTGWAHSSNSNIYRRIIVKAGAHKLKASLRDHAGEQFNYTHEETVNLAPGRIMVIDFKAATGGFIFKNKNVK